jgi:NAD(P)-dependent dehydrogenase (short-subunit alcohol dehydrogenase family)
LSPRALDAVLAIVMHGTAYVTLACGRRWLAEGRAGNVLSIVATYAETGSPYVVPSAMAKAGVLAMTRSLAVEWGGRGIRLNAIAPGPFPTEGAWARLVPNEAMDRAWMNKIPLGRVGEHRELADLAAFLLAEGSAYINGEVVVIDGGEWLKGAGQFSLMEGLSEADWAAMKGR